MNIARPVFLNKVEHNTLKAIKGINVIIPIIKIYPPMETKSATYLLSTNEIPLSVNEIDVGIITRITTSIYAKIFPQRNSQRLTGLLRNQDSDPLRFAPIILLEAKTIEKAIPKYKR
jgi:hypothetical protein